MDLKISLAGGGGGGSLVRLASLGGCSISEGVGSVFSIKQSNLILLISNHSSEFILVLFTILSQ